MNYHAYAFIEYVYSYSLSTSVLQGFQAHCIPQAEFSVAIQYVLKNWKGFMGTEFLRNKKVIQCVQHVDLSLYKVANVQNHEGKSDSLPEKNVL